MECCNRIVYPPPRSASDDVMGDDVVVDCVLDGKDVVANPRGRARVADDRRASQGLAGLVVICVFWRLVLPQMCRSLLWLLFARLWW